MQLEHDSVLAFAQERANILYLKSRIANVNLMGGGVTSLLGRAGQSIKGGKSPPSLPPPS